MYLNRDDLVGDLISHCPDHFADFRPSTGGLPYGTFVMIPCRYSWAIAAADLGETDPTVSHGLYAPPRVRFGHCLVLVDEQGAGAPYVVLRLRSQITHKPSAPLLARLYTTQSLHASL